MHSTGVLVLTGEACASQLMQAAYEHHAVWMVDDGTVNENVASAYSALDMMRCAMQ